MIKLDIENLAKLSQMVTGEMSTMLKECVTYLKESYNISEKENNQFDTRKYKLKEHFKKEIKLDVLESWVTTYNQKIRDMEDSLNHLNEALKIAQHFGITLPFASINTVVTEVFKSLKKNVNHLIENVYNQTDSKINKLFKNIDHDMKDGVPEEIMKHLKSTKAGILKVKNQNDIFGQQIQDCRTAMVQKDMTVMDGDLSIPNIGEHMVWSQRL